MLIYNYKSAIIPAPTVSYFGGLDWVLKLFRVLFIMNSDLRFLTTVLFLLYHGSVDGCGFSNYKVSAQIQF